MQISALRTYLRHFRDPLALILIAIGLVSYYLGETVNSLIILTMVFLSTTLNFIQEHRAGQAAAKLASTLAHQVLVKRAGREISIPSHDIVPGDILILQAGTLVPADARLLAARDLYVNEASLTGESFPIEKSLIYPHNLVKAGTSIVTGTAEALVYQTGAASELGKMNALLTEADTTDSFVHGINRFSRFILQTVVIFVITIFVLHTLIRGDILTSLTFAVAVAVGLTPEFLPMVMSVTMSRGSIRMNQKGVIVKRLSAIPTLGSMTILATDKTGTLTEDHVRLVRCLDIMGRESDAVRELATLNAQFQTGLTNPLDTAILEVAKPQKGFKKIDEIPYDFERRRLSIIVKKGQTAPLLICKGAPEAIFAVSKLERESLRTAEDLFAKLSREGYRVLALATRSLPRDATSYSARDEHHLSLRGLIAFLDPAKEGVKAALDNLESLGVEIKIITGDNVLVTEKICRDVGVVSRGSLDGETIDHLSDPELLKKLPETTIFARCSPSTKRRLCQLLRQTGATVGYLGDGINDALSLTAADLGISVNNAVDIAKEAADFILTHKSLAILKDGIVEGRKTFGNTMKYLYMGLSSSFGNMFSVFIAVLYLPFLPMLPLQILLNNFLYDLSQLTLPFDHVDTSYIQTPKTWNLALVKQFMYVMGPISSLFDVLTFVLVYGVFHMTDGSFQTSWFLESLLTQVFVIFIIRTEHLPFVKSRPHPLLVISALAAVVLGWGITLSPLGRYFGFVPIAPHMLWVILLIATLYLITAEIGKEWLYRHATWLRRPSRLPERLRDAMA
jgi:Mg2+-importing ATPase